MLGVNVFAAETDDEGRRLFTSLQQAFVNLRRGHPGPLPPPDDGFVERLTPGDRRLLDEMLAVLGGRLAGDGAARPGGVRRPHRGGRAHARLADLRSRRAAALL